MIKFGSETTEQKRGITRGECLCHNNYFQRDSWKCSDVKTTELPLQQATGEKKSASECKDKHKTAVKVKWSQEAKWDVYFRSTLRHKVWCSFFHKTDNIE